MSDPDQTRSEDAPKANWWREAGVYALLYGVPLLLLFPYTSCRPDAVFQTSVRCQSVAFTVGSSPAGKERVPYRKAGPFTGGCVDLNLTRVGWVILPGAQNWKPLGKKGTGGSATELWGGAVLFRNAEFRFLSIPDGTQVRMNWYEYSPTGAELLMSYAGTPPDLGAALFLKESSTVEFQGSSLSESGEAEDGVIQIPPGGIGTAEIHRQKGDSHFAVSITPCAAMAAKTVPAQPAAAAVVMPDGDKKSTVMPERPGGLPIAERIPLAPGSRVSFVNDDDSSAIFGAENSVQVKNADRTETLLPGQRLEIGKMKDPNSKDASEITLQIKDGIGVHVAGRAGVLQVDREDARPSLAEYLRANKILSVWLTTAILIGSALLTIVTRTKLVKLDGKGG